jgi:hypothetical protein
VRVLSTDSRTLPKGTTIAFLANGDAENLGVDPERVELIVEGTLVLNGDNGTAEPVTLLSTSSDPQPGDWYGVRIPAMSNLVPTDVVIRHGRAGVAWENDAWPPLSTLNDEIQYIDNVCEVSVDRDYTVATSTTLSIPTGWTIGFTAHRDESNSGADGGMDDGRVELIVVGDLDLNETVLKCDDPMVGPGGW